eukprot:PITA_31511
MANAFDRVDRSFLSKVLLSFGFLPQFVNLIKACIDKPWIAPLVNGRPTNFFQARRGIRQGCALSPFLYIIMADSLSRKLTAERLNGNILGLEPSHGVDALNHALFADDSLLLGRASIRIAKAIDTVLRSYCRASGALINERKSEVFSWNIDQRDLIGLTTISDSKVAFRLAPRNVSEQFSKLLRDFLWWGSKGSKNKIHLVNWDVVKKTIAEGGLQIRDPDLVNLVMGGKILWKLIHEPSHSISVLLRTKYGPNKSLSNLHNANTVNNTQVWKLCYRSSNFFNKQVYRIPNNGKRTHLWHDCIMGKEPLNINEDIADLKD